MAIPNLSGASNRIAGTIEKMKGTTTNGNEANCGYTVAKVFDQAGFNSKKIGVDPAVRTAVNNFESNGQVTKVNASNPSQVQPGDIGISNKDGHIVVAGKDGKFFGANESGRKSLDVSHYQAGKGIEKIYRPNEIGTGDNISTTA